jgi:hypothetical protein
MTMLCTRSIVGDADVASWWGMQHCMMSDQGHEPGNAQGCAEKLKLDWTKISACASGDAGAALLAKSLAAMKAETPAVTHAPDVRINGTPYTGTNYLKQICSVYSGTPPAGCSAESIAAVDAEIAAAGNFGILNSTLVYVGDDEGGGPEGPGRAAGVREVFLHNASPHYEDPNATGSCQAGEVDVQIQGIEGKMCAPQCSSSGACPTDVPAGVTAKPTCALQGMGGKYCALVCSPSTNERSLRAGDAQCGANASCKAIQGTGICTYDK